VVVNGDTTVESDETFNVNLSNCVGCIINDGLGVGNIQNDDTALASDPCDGLDNNDNGIIDEGAVGVDDDGDGTVDEEADACVNISINNVSDTEGDAGTKNFNFTVTRLGETSIASSVDFATSDGTATVADADYTANTGTLNFAIGETSKTVTVVVNGDTTVESDETFNVNLSNCIPNCEMVDGQGVGTILNDDAEPGLPDVSISDVSSAEGDSGTTDFNFTLTRSGDTSGASSIDFTTSDGSATTADSDYASNSGTVDFAANETSKTVTVVVNGDTTVEPNETFNVDLSNCVGCTISDSQGVGTIVNDDVVQPPVDTDNDGVPDDIDQCPDQPGPATNNGCPIVTEQPVGGEILGIETTSLFVAGAFANASWIIPIAGVTAAGIVGFALRKRFR
jgi:serralysin